jgi:hypothetical protein
MSGPLTSPRRDEAQRACLLVHRPDPAQVPNLDPMVFRVVLGDGPTEGHLIEVDVRGLDARLHHVEEHLKLTDDLPAPRGPIAAGREASRQTWPAPAVHTHEVRGLRRRQTVGVDTQVSHIAPIHVLSHAEDVIRVCACPPRPMNRLFSSSSATRSRIIVTRVSGRRSVGAFASSLVSTSPEITMQRAPSSRSVAQTAARPAAFTR